MNTFTVYMKFETKVQGRNLHHLQSNFCIFLMIHKINVVLFSFNLFALYKNKFSNFIFSLPSLLPSYNSTLRTLAVRPPLLN